MKCGECLATCVLVMVNENLRKGRPLADFRQCRLAYKKNKTSLRVIDENCHFTIAEIKEILKTYHAQGRRQLFREVLKKLQMEAGMYDR